METGKKKISPLPAAKRALKKKAIAREFERKRRELGLNAPTVKRGLGFYLILMVGMALIASLVFKQAGMVEKRKSVNTKQLFAQRSVPGWLGPYAGSWGTIIPDPWKRPYIYEPQTNGPPVVLSLGADGVRGTADDVMPDAALFEKPFVDPSWTNDWVHFSKRGIILVPKKQVEK